MKIPLNDIQIIYEKLIADINVAKVSVGMFTALDVDALCTLKIISVKHGNILEIAQELKHRIQNLPCFHVHRIRAKNRRLPFF